jgi:hypothetical protein
VTRTPISTLISQLYAQSSFAFVLDFDIGGAVSSFDPDSTETSLTPATRRTSASIEMFAAWDATSGSKRDAAAAFAKTAAWTAQLRAVMPNSGAYFSESDYNQPRWQEAFWGKKNYARLQKVKERYDRRGVFSCHHCVELPK